MLLCFCRDITIVLSALMMKIIKHGKNCYLKKCQVLGLFNYVFIFMNACYQKTSKTFHLGVSKKIAALCIQYFNRISRLLLKLI